MKKSMLSAVVVLVMGFGMTNTVFASEKMQAVEVAQEQEEVTYSKIETAELPEAVTEALAGADYADFTICKAFLGSDKSYKVVLSEEGTETLCVFFKADGELIKTEEIKA